MIKYQQQQKQKHQQTIVKSNVWAQVNVMGREGWTEGLITYFFIQYDTVG